MARSNRGKVVRHTLKSSATLWDDDVVILSLRNNMRVQNEINKYPNDEAMHERLRQHEQWLLKLGEGRLPSLGKFDDHSIVEIPSDMCHESKDDVVDEVFDDFELNIGDKSYFRSRILLAATNEIVDEVNDELVERISGDLYTYRSIDTVADVDNQTMFPTEYLNRLRLSGLPESELKLKVNTVVILMRNMDIKAGHCNGTRYLIKHMGQYRLVLEKLHAEEGDKNKVLILPRIPMKHAMSDKFAFELTRLQFPIKIAFALTMNRAQGQSAEKCGILLPKHVWAHGQIYVAFSRCGNPNNVHVWAEQSLFEKHDLDPAKKYVANVVYSEVLQDEDSDV